jgi:transposase
VNKITTLGIDLAKTVFQLHGLDCAGKVVLCREVRRTQLMRAIAQLEPCLIGIEACGGASYPWVVGQVPRWSSATPTCRRNT